MKKPSNSFKKIERIFIKMEDFLFFIAIIALLVILAGMLSGVISREVFNKSILWTTDLSGYSMVYLVFLAAPKILREGGHVLVDLFTSMMAPRLSRGFSALICLVSMVCCALLFYFSLQITWDYYTKGIVMLDNVPWPRYMLTLPIVIGFLFLTIRFTLEFFKSLLYGKTIFENTENLT